MRKAGKVTVIFGAAALISVGLASGGAQAAPCAGIKNGDGPGTCLVITETLGPSENPNAATWSEQRSSRGNGSSQGIDQTIDSNVLNPGGQAPPGQQ
jgi:hypothetical protein